MRRSLVEWAKAEGINLTVVPAADWYRDVRTVAPFATPEKRLRRAAALFTTQKHVDTDVVARWKQRIKAGEDARVEVIYAGKRLYVLDGHHRLVAHLELGGDVPIYLYRNAFIGDKVPPPRFRGKS